MSSSLRQRAPKRKRLGYKQVYDPSRSHIPKNYNVFASGVLYPQICPPRGSGGFQGPAPDRWFTSILQEIQRAWRALPPEEKERLRDQSRSEFAKQRAALVASGVRLPGVCVERAPKAYARPEPRNVIVGGYVLTDLLGEGSYSKTYKAVSQRTGSTHPHTQTHRPT